MTNFLIHPALFIGGLIAVLSPIIIHLLNKRRFKRVDWAAMDFLLLAQKLNRRKVKLEEMILLLLRCLAMALIGLLLARPFLSHDSGAKLFSGSRHERVIVLDDSLSMKAQGAGSSPLEAARKMLDEWVSGLASRGSDDSITVIRASEPSKPLFNAVPLSEASVSEILREFAEMQASDVPASLAAALGEVEKMLEDQTKGGGVNRIVYVLTDMRRKDWEGAPASVDTDEAGEKDAVATLKRIASKAAGCYVIDLGVEGQSNLAIDEIAPGDKALIAGVATEFEVVVRNLGKEVANDVGIRFAAADALPLEASIDRIEPGETGAVAFSYTFAAPDTAPGTGAPEPVVLKAEIVTGDGTADLLPDDNTRFFAARVARGLRVLVVDGDPSGAFGGSESYFLTKALSPRGAARSGIEVAVVDDSDLDETRLDDFQVVFLANLYRVTPERRKKLEDWVGKGGGLIVGLGDQVDEDVYNEELYAGGTGLLPAQLDAIGGDETEESWAFFDPVKENHPVLRIFEGNSNPLLEAVKIFRWWRVVPDEAAEKEGRATVIARFTDEEKSPAFVETRFGEGHVMLVSTSLDVDWNNWPEDGASYLIVMQELARYMARSNAREGAIATGQELDYGIDLADYRAEASVIQPSGSKVAVQAQRPEGESETAATRWEIAFDDTRERGFYRLQLTPTDGGEEQTVLFAANIDSGEGQLARVDAAGMEADLAEGGVRLVREKESVFDLGAVTGKSEFWKLVLYLLAAILCVELAFAWWLGARRGHA
jgi:hypothetical protein